MKRRWWIIGSVAAVLVVGVVGFNMMGSKQAMGLPVNIGAATKSVSGEQSSQAGSDRGSALRITANEKEAFPQVVQNGLRTASFRLSRHCCADFCQRRIIQLYLSSGQDARDMLWSAYPYNRTGQSRMCQCIPDRQLRHRDIQTSGDAF